MQRNSHLKTQLGQKNKQAIVLRCKANQVAFSQCRFKGYQDILYAKIRLKIYRDCDIEGIVDFILGML